MTKSQQLSTKFNSILFGVISSIISLGCTFVLLFLYLRSSNPHSISFQSAFYFIMALSLLNTFLILLNTHHYSVRLKRQAAQIEEHNKKLAEAEKETMRANLLRAVSHDLRTPLTGIIGNSLAYIDHNNILTEEEKNTIVQNIYEDSTWLINMVENLLTVTRISGSDLTINTSEESVEEVVSEALQKVQKRHDDCQIEASVPEDFLLLKMDPMLIEQVMINLLENALFHSGTTAPIEFLVSDHPDHVSFTIRDHGNGIPADRLEHLFDGKDYTVSSSDVQKGMGIGLVICKTIIAAHHGTIIGRNYEDGAEFTFTLPKKDLL